MRKPLDGRNPCFRTLTVDDAGCGLGLPACRLTDPFSKDVVHVFQHPSDAPFAVLGKHRAPGGEIYREESPGTAGLQDVFAGRRAWRSQAHVENEFVCAL